jgi:hypothetical protein
MAQVPQELGRLVPFVLVGDHKIRKRAICGVYVQRSLVSQAQRISRTT